jgi:ParB/RepB/Spo0J family partition protein
MAITDIYKRVPLSEIKVSREDRQRKEISVDDLKSSIALHGVLVPIILSSDYTLVAGERRLTASKLLGLPDIPVRFADDLSPEEFQTIELEENIKRKALSWQEEVDAVNKLHEIFIKKDETWTAAKTAKALALSPATISNYLLVSQPKALEKTKAATTLSQAVSIIKKQEARQEANIINDVIASMRPKEAQVEIIKESILHADFSKWVQTYSGPPFNFLHCDFPYGINVFAGAWSGRDTTEGYTDSQDVYWNLIKTLCENLDKVLASNGHLMFWFSMEHYQQTLDTFAKLAPDLQFQKFPLFWMKSDNTGIVPDFRREGRRVYETAFIASRGDRFILSPVGNAYAAPVERTYHPSTKPEPVLRHFFRMFVDEHTRMLDPTCGGGSSIRAAESLNAEHVLGLEISEEYFKNAQTALKQFRVLRGN